MRKELLKDPYPLPNGGAIDFREEPKSTPTTSSPPGGSGEGLRSLLNQRKGAPATSTTTQQ